MRYFNTPLRISESDNGCPVISLAQIKELKAYRFGSRSNMRTDSLVKLKEAFGIGFRRESRDMSIVCFCQWPSGDRLQVPYLWDRMTTCKGFAEDGGHDSLAHVGICSIDLIRP